eukprot:268533-Rhodomonas_salina.1
MDRIFMCNIPSMEKGLQCKENGGSTSVSTRRSSFCDLNQNICDCHSARGACSAAASGSRGVVECKCNWSIDAGGICSGSNWESAELQQVKDSGCPSASMIDIELEELGAEMDPEGMSTAEIVGIVVGGLAFMGSFVCALFCLIRRAQKQAANVQGTSGHPGWGHDPHRHNEGGEMGGWDGGGGGGDGGGGGKEETEA